MVLPANAGRYGSSRAIKGRCAILARNGNWVSGSAQRAVLASPCFRNRRQQRADWRPVSYFKKSPARGARGKARVCVAVGKRANDAPLDCYNYNNNST